MNVSCSFEINFNNGQLTWFSILKEVSIRSTAFTGQNLIPVVEEAKCLGVIFDRKLSFVPHLKYVKKKGLKVLNILKVIGNTEWGADQKVMLRLYRSLVRSNLDDALCMGQLVSLTCRCWFLLHNQSLSYVLEHLELL